ncbi:MAG: DUF177 domain-containing protein [Kiritimatiellaeota bacterium]|nr:DUF177 domain-containing protein [Kiritimatiellota bacterium]
MKQGKNTARDGLPMKCLVNMRRLREEGEWFEGELHPRALDVEEDGLLRIAGPMRYRVNVMVAGEEVLARGRVEQRLGCVCGRCAADFELDVREPDFFAAFPCDEAVEFLDLTPELREAILLALPSYPVCKEDCLGLCVRCGANLNTGTCSCPPGARDEQWAALDQLVLRRPPETPIQE